MKITVLFLTLVFASLLGSAQTSSFDTALVLHLPLDGTTIEVIHNYNVSNTGFTWVEDRGGNDSSAIRLSGGNNHLIVDSFGMYIPTEEITVAFWAKPAKVKSCDMTMLMPNNESNRFAVMYFYSHNGVPYHFFDFGSAFSNRIYVANIQGDTQWHYITCTSSKYRDEVAMYLDGVQINTHNNPATFIRGDRDLWIGGGKDTDFEGVMDDYRIYNLALDSSQVAQLYQAQFASLHTYQNVQFRLFPNPASTAIHVELPSNQNFTEYELNIYSTDGRVVYHSKFYSSDWVMEASAIGLKGLYFFEVCNPQASYRSTKKIYIH